MDPSLLKDFNAFKKRSLATPAVVESKKRPPASAGHQDPSRPKKKRRRPELPAQLLQQAKKQALSLTFKTHNQIRTKNRFSILASIVDLVKSRYQDRSFDAFSLEQLLDI